VSLEPPAGCPGSRILGLAGPRRRGLTDLGISGAVGEEGWNLENVASVGPTSTQRRTLPSPDQKEAPTENGLMGEGPAALLRPRSAHEPVERGLGAPSSAQSMLGAWAPSLCTRRGHSTLTSIAPPLCCVRVEESSWRTLGPSTATLRNGRDTRQVPGPKGRRATLRSVGVFG